jgi:Tfp pilus assembly protein PilW
VIRVVRARLRGDAGVSLVELLIVTMLSTLVLTLVVIMFTNVARVTVSTTGERDSSATAANIMDVVSTDIRAATRVADSNPNDAIDDSVAAVLAGTARQLTIITYSDTGPDFSAIYQVRYRIVDGQLLRDQWDPAVATGRFPHTGAPTSTRVLGESIATGTVFRYFRQAADNSLDRVEIPVADVAANRARITAIQVDLRVTAPDSRETVHLRNRVGLPNAGGTS